MDRTYLQWNIVNWLTVILMASVGVMLIGFIGAGIKTYQPAGNPNSQG